MKYNDEEKEKRSKKFEKELDELKEKRKKKSAFSDTKEFFDKLKRQINDAFSTSKSSDDVKTNFDELNQTLDDDTNYDYDTTEPYLPNDIEEETDEEMTDETTGEQSYDETMEEDEDLSESPEETSQTNEETSENELTEETDDETEISDDNETEETTDETAKSKKEKTDEEKSEKPEEEGKIEKGEDQTPKTEQPDTDTPEQAKQPQADSTTPDTTTPDAQPPTQKTPEFDDPSKAPGSKPTTSTPTDTPTSTPSPTQPSPTSKHGTQTPAKPNQQPKIEGPKGKAPPMNNAGKVTDAKKTADTAKKAQQTAKTAEKATKTAKTAQKAAKTAKVASTAAGAAGKKGLMSLIVSTIPWSLIIIAAIIVLIMLLLFIIVVVAAASFAQPVEDIDPANGQFSTIYGVTGDNFYGTRIIYLDQSKSEEELHSYYYSLATDYINKLDALDNVDVNTSVKDNTISTLTLEIANAVSPLEDSNSINDLIASITHFGYTTKQLADIKTRLTRYLTDNQSNIFVSTNSEEPFDISNEIETTFDENYSSLNITSPLYYVKDIILEEDEMIPQLELKNYVAMIYMPKEDVKFSGAQYLFYVPDESIIVNFDFYLPTSSEPKSFVVDKSWYVEDGFIDEETGEKEYFKTADIDTLSLEIPLQKFTSIDENNLEFLNGQSIYSILTGNVIQNEEDSETADSSSSLDEDASDSEEVIPEIVNVAITEENKTNFEKYFFITTIDGVTYLNYLPTTDTNFMYLKFNANGNFQFVESDMEITQ